MDFWPIVPGFVLYLTGILFRENRDWCDMAWVWRLVALCSRWSRPELSGRLSENHPPYVAHDRIRWGTLMLPREDFMLPYELQHRHSDGSSHRMERAHHDPAQHDPERSWPLRQEFQCLDCDETVTLIPNEET